MEILLQGMVAGAVLQTDPTKPDPGVIQPGHTGNSGGILTVGEAAVEVLFQRVVAAVPVEAVPAVHPAPTVRL